MFFLLFDNKRHILATRYTALSEIEVMDSDHHFEGNEGIFDFDDIFSEPYYVGDFFMNCYVLLFMLYNLDMFSHKVLKKSHKLDSSCKYIDFRSHLSYKDAIIRYNGVEYSFILYKGKLLLMSSNNKVAEIYDGSYGEASDPYVIGAFEESKDKFTIKLKVLTGTMGYLTSVVRFIRSDDSNELSIESTGLENYDMHSIDFKGVNEVIFD